MGVNRHYLLKGGMVMIKNFRDILALILILLIPLLWVLSSLVMPLSGEVLGASIAVWTLVAQFYFRKKESETSAS